MSSSLEKAISLIDMTLRHNDGHGLPYFFVVGAGISAPEIPLAREIIELCKKEIRQVSEEDYERCLEEMRQYENSAVKSYSGWIERAYPNRVHRSWFLKSIIRGKKISSANLMLANILYSKKVATTVFTTNFDDKLKRALELIGVTDMFIAENEMDNLVVSPQSEDIQVVHVHGTYNFYDCANLEKEIQSVASHNDTISCSHLLRNFLNDRAPIVVGYSGWEDDVIMTCLRERLSYPTPLQYIWVCHSRSAYDALPKWLRDSPSVHFAVPEFSDEQQLEEERAFVQGAAGQRQDVIEAVDFFNLLIAAVKLGMPEIFENPSSYYSKRIDSLLPENEDVLHLRHWAERMKILGEAHSPAEKFFRQLERADVANNIVEAAEAVKGIAEQKLSEENVRYVSQHLIGSVLRKENGREPMADRLGFRMAVLAFTEENCDTLRKEGMLNDFLMDMILWHWKQGEQESCCILLDRICAIAEKDISTMEVQLAAIGLKSAIVAEHDEEQSITLLKHLVQISQPYVGDQSICYYHCVALYNLAKLQTERAAEYVQQADLLARTVPESRLPLISARHKSYLVGQIQDEELQIAWICDVTRFISKFEKEIGPAETLLLSSNISWLPAEALERADGANAFLEDVYERNRKKDLNQNVCWLGLAKLSVELCRRAGNGRKAVSYFEDFKVFCGKIPGRLSKELWTDALSVYCAIPLPDVSDEMKIEELIQFQKLYPETGLLYSSLQAALRAGDKGKYESCPELKEELDYYEKTELLRRAYERYSEKDYEKAEELFSSLLECGHRDLEITAKNDLSFMVRRKETVQVQWNFWSLVKGLPDDFGFNHMNTVLYCLAENLTDDPRYEEALRKLGELSDGQIQELWDCWSDVAFVGAPEAELGMELIRKYCNPCRHSLRMIIGMNLEEEHP